MPNGKKAIAYSEIIPLLVEAIKKQQNEIDELKQVNEKIERTSKNIEKRLKNIETSIVQYHNIEDTFLIFVANGFIEKDK